ncbi:hypothetical protein SKAU_G00105580 [Synaphobranchus kaupii]|uniref:Uncharacterized protein n=1 Tax=Synaphobranchus kaupii TaxID=118154 RepID=A0A9Q1J5P8_SYNKA|nr:hypothetical protein SKAU_G00105580 [Synaphobranchus kaupii]
MIIGKLPAEAEVPSEKCRYVVGSISAVTRLAASCERGLGQPCQELLHLYQKSGFWVFTFPGVTHVVSFPQKTPLSVFLGLQRVYPQLGLLHQVRLRTIFKPGAGVSEVWKFAPFAGWRCHLPWHCSGAQRAMAQGARYPSEQALCSSPCLQRPIATPFSLNTPLYHPSSTCNSSISTLPPRACAHSRTVPGEGVG